MTVGDPGTDDEIQMGPVISAEQQSAKLDSSLRAQDANATVLTGGGTVGDRGFFVAPTIVSDVAQDSEIVQSEVFGPVVTVQRVARRRGDRDGQRRPAWASPPPSSPRTSAGR